MRLGWVRRLNYTGLVADNGLVWRPGAVACHGSGEFLVGDHIVEERTD